MNWALAANWSTQLLRGEKFPFCGELHPSSNLNFSLSLSSSKWPSWTFHSRLHQSGLSAKTLHHPIQSRAAMQPGDNLGTFSSWSFHSGMKASFHLHLLCKSFRLLLWCMQIAAEATRLKKTKWKLNWRAQSELVTKIQDYNFFIRILGSLHGDCKKEGLSIWAEFDMLMRCLHTREVTQSQSNHPRPSQFFQVKTFPPPRL